MDEKNQRINKKTLIPKKLARFLTINWHEKSSSFKETLLSKTQSNASKMSDSKHKATPKGCFSVYVGSEKQRFVIKTELANHPLFRMLLEDVELEYGFSSEGPLLIPCEVDLFCKILVEMDSGKDDFDQFSCGLWSPFNSPFNSKTRLGQSEGCSSYEHLTPM
ncbi:auxin-responsive protein SAUR71-like [Primulina huaijiensis]|uniref:auxin-responsive protein SAUR71-like n=1 Tax=Primulina huaijiensis TaxID=1492673 RepID=UPI003CC6FDC7